ncbi:SDR family oxidoreductase [bacterium]|nr:SDR family oxidoreductase [bacterium]
MGLLSNKVALITGSSRGIGAATAKLFAENGAAVVVNYVSNSEAADLVVADIVEVGGKAIAIQADAADQNQVKKMVSKAINELGKIDILVLNASITFPVVPFLEFKWEDFEYKLTRELKAAFFCCKEVVPGMIEKKKGTIVAVSSGLSRQPGPGFIAHSTAKSGLDSFAKSLAMELGPHGIRVNVIAPGLTLTDATAFHPEEIKQIIAANTPLRRLAKPEDIAGAILMMASDHSEFVSGTYTPVSGGMQME